MSTESSPAAIVPGLLNWMAGARRDLPWRRRRDPYAVWISEIMLQQTQVSTVVPYFERWMARFPGVDALANAPLEAILKLWEGLGYYARARNLQRAAQQIVAQYSGEFPDERKALLALPGIGRYTAGAILSLAFGLPEPVLDGNVRRVLCRLYDIAEDPRLPATERRLWELATTLVEAAPAGHAGDLNEALMELGALVCVPGVPDCPACPLADLCLAHGRSVQTERPVSVEKRPTPHYEVAAAVIGDEAGRLLIARRPVHGLLGGLWEFPSTPAGPGGTGQKSAEQLPDFLVRALRERLDVEISVGAPVCQVKHAYTHFRITLSAFRCTLLAGEPHNLDYAEVRWVAPGELDTFPFPVTHLKILRALGLR